MIKMLMALILVFFVVIFPVQTIAAPIISSTINEGTPTSSTQVYSNGKVIVFIPDDMIHFNLFGTDYNESGNFIFTLFFYFEDEKIRQSFVDDLKEQVKNKDVNIIGLNTPDALECISMNCFFDMKKQHIIVTDEAFIDYDGDLLGIQTSQTRSVVDLNEKYPVFMKIANNCISILESTKNEPKIAAQLAYYENLKKDEKQN